ncbi:MAG TPA: sensor histidine kinase, partial [Methylophaga aminisulfidivorans]|nr:sensor histidine kinase [Methylophaga aminisulfidivorans]
DRNFIFLINVVVAGETTEIKILADQLKEQSIKEQKALQQNVFIKMTIYQQATLVGSFILLMFAIFISRFVAKSVSIPVKQIADTFSQLTSGHEIEQIPGVDRKDEIGQLARSANVFRENALQTKQLLTESNRLTKSLEAKQAELEMRNTELDNFAYVASHDLKSPLRAIFNLAEWIEEDCYDILPDDSKRHFDTLRSRILRMERLLAELLSYSRVGRVDQDIDIIDVRAVITESIELLDKPASLNMHIQDEFPQILGRETPFKQVFQNIISNAFKYNDKPNCELTISCRKINDSAHEYTIADNGPGIDEDYHNNVFDMFTTLQSRDSIESTGMGLAIVKKVLENEGGSIRIEDNHPGCRFVFCWPDKPLKDS